MHADLKLYQANGSPNSRRVRILLAEKGITPTQVAVGLGTKEQFSDAYLAINSCRTHAGAGGSHRDRRGARHHAPSR